MKKARGELLDTLPRKTLRQSKAAFTFARPCVPKHIFYHRVFITIACNLVHRLMEISSVARTGIMRSGVAAKDDQIPAQPVI